MAGAPRCRGRACHVAPHESKPPCKSDTKYQSTFENAGAAPAGLFLISGEGMRPAGRWRSCPSLPGLHTKVSAWLICADWMSGFPAANKAHEHKGSHIGLFKRGA